LSDILTISTGLKLRAGALLHKLGQKIVAAFQKAKADAKELEASVKKAVSDVRKGFVKVEKCGRFEVATAFL